MDYYLELDYLYNETIDKTLNSWSENKSFGNIISLEKYRKNYAPLELAIVFGITPNPTEEIIDLFHILNDIVKGDILADITPLNSFHFTFLAVTKALYKQTDTLKNIENIKCIFNSLISPHIVEIKELKLIPLKNQLLLVGFPDPKSYLLRKELVQVLLKSSWKTFIEQRYTNLTLPPPFWHSTLIRYKADYLPNYLRDFYIHYSKKLNTQISSPIRLVMTNYNWTEVHDI